MWLKAVGSLLCSESYFPFNSDRKKNNEIQGLHVYQTELLSVKGLPLWIKLLLMLLLCRCCHCWYNNIILMVLLTHQWSKTLLILQRPEWRVEGWSKRLVRIVPLDSIHDLQDKKNTYSKFNNYCSMQLFHMYSICHYCSKRNYLSFLTL